MIRLKWSIPVVVAACFGLAVSQPSAIAAPVEAPGWQLVANTYPTNLVRGVSEVEEVTTVPGSFTLGLGGQQTGAIASGATATKVQEALESLSSIGAGNVVVSEEAGHPGTYVVTFGSLLGNMQLPTLETTGTASASIRTAGTFSGTVAIEVFNVGAGPSTGTITVTDTLPPGVKAKEAGELLSPGEIEGFGIRPTIGPNVWDCTGNGPGPAPKVLGASIVKCTNDPAGLAKVGGGGGLPTWGFETFANPQPMVGIAVEVESKPDEPQHTSCVGGPAYCNRVTIIGGGAAETASTEDAVTISSKAPPGGLVSANAWFSNPDGTVDRQAGSHPYTATFVFNVATALNAKREGVIAGSEVRDLETQVPPGLIGDLHNIPQCRQGELIAEHCPPSSMVGGLSAPNFIGSIEKQVFNMVPPLGTPAELGFVVANTIARVTFTVKSGSDYGILAHVEDVPQRETYQGILTLWGTPEESSHDRWRHTEGGCTEKEMEEPVLSRKINYCARQQGPVVQPVLTLPTACGAAQPFLFRELSGWQEPSATSEVSFLSHDPSGKPVGFEGCESLAFEPAFAATPDTLKADTAAGLNAEVTPPLGGLEEPGALATADMRNARVTLPEGFVINPGQAAGLQACPPGRPAPGHPEGDALTTPDEIARGEEDNEAAICPGASKVGTVTIDSPLIESASEKQIHGNVYLLQSNPPEVRLLIAGSADGVNVKLGGTVHLNEQTGRLETVFDNIPQFPVGKVKLSFTGDPQQALVTPAHCGVYTTSVDFTPWSTPLASDFFGNTSFAITQGPGGTACPPSPLPFALALTAGSLNDQAGGFTSFSTLLQRGDGQQRIEKLRLTTPKGFAGMISSVPLCGTQQAQLGTCAAAARIGHAIVTAGPGSTPLTIPQPGEPEVPIYLTGPYKGAPFGLSIVTPVIAGPFNLGTIVTRAKLEVDPHTAQVTIVTDPLPQIVKGVPTDLRSIYAVIDRPGFTFNPTNCESQESTGAVTGAAAPGAAEPAQSAAVSSRFALGGCRGLTFSPTLSVSTAAKASRLNGASLKFKISYPHDAFAKQSRFREAKFTFPKQLPARLPTLHQACDAKIFEGTRGSCPKHSVIGHAVVHTPVLPVPLEGPVYFVSHKNASFPDAVMVLSGDNVTIELKGETLIRNGITSATFRSLPDAPFETFEVTLPSGEFSEFGEFLPARANNSFCGQKLKMPTLLVSQNGLELNSSTPISVTGCPRAHKHKAKRSATRRHARPKR
jgi:hypothetical protein